VAINPTDQEQPLNLSLRNLRGVALLKVHRTSADENLKAVGDVPVADARAAVAMPPRSMVTLAGKVAQ